MEPHSNLNFFSEGLKWRASWIFKNVWPLFPEILGEGLRKYQNINRFEVEQSELAEYMYQNSISDILSILQIYLHYKVSLVRFFAGN